jgi:hypothetical protein
MWDLNSRPLVPETNYLPLPPFPEFYLILVNIREYKEILALLFALYLPKITCIFALKVGNMFGKTLWFLGIGAVASAFLPKYPTLTYIIYVFINVYKGNFQPVNDQHDVEEFFLLLTRGSFSPKLILRKIIFILNTYESNGCCSS